MAKRSLKGQLVEFDRSPVDPHTLVGFALDWTEDLTLRQVLNKDRMELNGYSVIRNADVRQWRELNRRSLSWRALKLKGIEPVTPVAVSLGGWREVLESAGLAFPLLTLHREKMRPGCNIGRVQSMTDKVVTLKEIDPHARWGESRRYRFADLTKVDFGGGYEQALWMVSEANKRR